MKGLKDPKELVDSVIDGAIGAAQFFPRVAENVAKVADNYAVSANKNINDLKAQMPAEPEVIPRLVVSMVGQTVGAGFGLFEAVGNAFMTTTKDIKSQISRGTGG